MLKSFDPLSNKKLRFIVLTILFITALILRTYKLDKIPSGLNQDETSIGYNAYSILETGKDEYGISYPLYFDSFGDHKLPVYIYTTAVFVKIFGLNEYAVRLPSALAGLLAVIVLYLLVKHVTKNNTLAFIASFLLTINPMHLLFSRAGFEVNFALTAALVGTYLFILGSEGKKLWLLFLSILSFGLCLYTYNVTRLIAPLFIFSLTLLYWERIKQFKLSQLSILILSLVLIVSPFVISFFSPAGVFSAQSSLITSSDILAKNIEFRSYLAPLPALLVKILYNKYSYAIFQYFQNIANILSGTFFFVSGSLHPNQGIGNVGVFYLFELPLFIAGMVLYYQKGLQMLRVLNVWLLISFAVLALSKDVPHATRGYFLILPIVAFSALGFFFFLQLIINLKYRLIKYGIALLVVFFMLYNIQFYFFSYYYRFPSLYASQWRKMDRDLSLYIKNVNSSYDKVIIDTKTDFIYSSFLFYTKYPPQKFIDSVERYKDGALLKARSWGGKYEVRPIDWVEDVKKTRTLLITTNLDKPAGIPVLELFYNPLTYLVLSVDDSIVSSPIKEAKYVIIDSDAARKFLTKE